MTSKISTAKPRLPHTRQDVIKIMNSIVMALSVLLIVWISYDTFRKINFLENHQYMQFQFWVCIFFILDFFVELALTDDKWRFFRHRLLFLLLSIPYLNIINEMQLHLSHDALFFIRFVPLARGALALAIVIGYLSSNAVTSMFMSYIVILLLVTYFCSLIFFQREYGVNQQVDSYWTALWWTAMNLSTVGCDISPVTISGKIVAVILPIMGMIMFPLFTVYLTDYVTRTLKKERASNASDDNTGDIGQ